MKDQTKFSYTAADSLPAKLLQSTDTIAEIVTFKRIPPIHVQLIPTNKCNLKCSFCSCANEDHSLELDSNKMNDLVEDLEEALTEAVTITGGGEPLLYPYLDELVEKFIDAYIQVGMVTNGLLLEDKEYDWTWCRVSCSDDRSFKKLEKKLEPAVMRNPHIDWAVSYVVTKKCDYDNIERAIKFANDYKFTHVRLVSDLLDVCNVPPMEDIKTMMESRGVNVSNVIFQGRKEPVQGSDCYICYLKPVITPLLKVYACCGAMYALNPPSLKFPEELCLGTLKEFLQKREYKPLNGKICHKCYYNDYNLVLKTLMTPLKHKRFV